MMHKQSAMAAMVRSVAALLLLGALVGLGAQAASEQLRPLSLGKEALNFVVLGDWGREGMADKDKKTPGQLKVAKQLAATADALSPSFVVTAGDNFHGKGVPSPTDSLWAVNFERVYAAKSLMVPWYIALGNHDYEGSVDAELGYARTGDRWTQPARYYAFTRELADSTLALFVVLDSSPFVREYINEKDDKHHVKGQDAAAQVAWCDSVLSHSPARWKLAFFHHPAYSAGSKHGNTPEIQQALVPLFEKYHVDACFSGHDHDLQHSHPEGSTVEYFAVGGGSDTRPAGRAPFTRFSQASLGFGVVSLTRNQMQVTLVNEVGTPLYAYTIAK